MSGSSLALDTNQAIAVLNDAEGAGGVPLATSEAHFREVEELEVLLAP